MVGIGSPPRRVRAVALHTSGMALTLMLAGPAFAQCAPEPTQSNGTTICTGTDANGVTVTTYGTTVSVPTGATVLGGGRPPVSNAKACARWARERP